jgi:hypothetical protein
MNYIDRQARWVGDPMVLRPRSLSTGLGSYVVTVFVAAWIHARTLPAPWYGPELSQVVYAAYLGTAGALLAGIVVAASRRTASLDRRIAEIDVEIRAAKGITTQAAAVPAGNEGVVEPDDVDKDIDDLLGKLSDIGEDSDEATAEVTHSAPPIAVVASPPPSSVPKELVAEKQGLVRARRSVFSYALGPALVATAYLAVSGAMLPGTGAFLQSFHQLNTALILGMAYGWFGLGAAVVAGTFAHLKEPRPSKA